MEIFIGKGITNLQFGDSEPQLVGKLGKPDKVYESEGSKRLQFFDLQIEAAFEFEYENRFGWVEVKNPTATLFGQKLMGASIEEVLTFITNTLTETPEHTDYGSFDSYFYDKHWLELQFAFNRLRSINFGVLFDDNDAPMWP